MAVSSCRFFIAVNFFLASRKAACSGDRKGATADARRPLKLCDPPLAESSGVIETACCHASLAGLAGRLGSGLSKGESEIEAGHAVGFLLTLVALGYRNLNEIQAEAGLDSLHSRGDFKSLMMGVAFRLEPFAWAE